MGRIKENIKFYHSENNHDVFYSIALKCYASRELYAKVKGLASL
ncbi:MAG: hypothetical protein QXP55_02415 [Nitrososphaerales archaeon]